MGLSGLFPAPHLTRNPVFIQTLDRVNSTRIGAHLYAMAEEDGVQFQLFEDGSDGPEAAYMESRHWWIKPKVFMRNSNLMFDDYVVHELAHHQAKRVASVHDFDKKAPLAFVFQCTTGEAHAVALQELHRTQSITPSHEISHGEAQMLCAIQFISALGSEEIKESYIPKYLRTLDKNISQRNHAVPRGVRHLAIETGLAGWMLTAGWAANPASLLFMAALVLPTMGLEINALVKFSGFASEENEASLKKAYEQTRQIAELPYGWGNYVDFGNETMLFGKYGQEGYAENLIGPELMDYVRHIERKLDQSRTLNLLKKAHATLTGRHP